MSQSRVITDDIDKKLSRLITACLRCRQRKVKCDRSFPRCGNCCRMGVDCVVLDKYSGEMVSRASISSLKEQLKNVTEELNALKKQMKIEAVSDGNIPNHDQAPLRQSNQEFKFGRVLLMTQDNINKISEDSKIIDDIPDRSFAEECVHSFFSVTNIQIPTMHRDYYLFNYFKPLYGSVGSVLLSKLFGDSFNKLSYSETKYNSSNLDEVLRGKCLFFLNIIIAISTSQYQQKYVLSVSNHYKDQAYKFVDYVWRNAGTTKNDPMAKLEILQSLLLLTQYSLMRPCNPGAWYLVGTCVRLCQDLGLYNEPAYLHSNNYFIIDMRRRLFWCCFCLDRQISIYFERQFGIDNRKIDCPLLTIRDDSLLLYGDSEMKNVRTWLLKEPNDKEITIHFINLRVIQGDIFDYTHDTEGVIPSVDSSEYSNIEVQAKLLEHERWKITKYEELNAWVVEASQDGLASFTKMIFELNYNQTLISLFGVSLITPKVSNAEHHVILYRAGQKLIHIYADLVKRKLINFSWVAVNNLFLGASTYLLSISQCEKLLHEIDIQEFTADCENAVMSFQELAKVCHDPSNEFCNRFQSQRDALNWRIKSIRMGSCDSKNSDPSAFNVFSTIGGSAPNRAKNRADPKLSTLPGDTSEFNFPNNLDLQSDPLLHLMMGSVNNVNSSFQSEDVFQEFDRYANDFEFE